MRVGIIIKINELLCKYDIGATSVPDTDEYILEALDISKTIKSTQKSFKRASQEFNVEAVYAIVANRLKEGFAFSTMADSGVSVFDEGWLPKHSNEIKNLANEIFEFISKDLQNET